MTDLNTNIEKAQSYLARFRQDGVLNHINGQAVGADSGEQFEVISPIDLEPIAKVARGGASDIDKAAKAAKASFAAWAAMPGKERKKLLHRIANAIEARAEEIAFVESVDTGQAIRFMSKAALRGAENFRFFCGSGTHGAGRRIFARTQPAQCHQPHPNRPRGHHHPVEHALYALHLENCPGPGRRLHHRAQAS